MVTIGETCKLCFRYTEDDVLTALGDEILMKLEFLRMDLVSASKCLYFSA